MRRKILVIITSLTVVVLLGLFMFKQTVLSPSHDTTLQKDETKQEIKFPKDKHSTTDALSPWVVVNKNRPLNPLEYSPTNLTAPKIALRGDANSDEMKLTIETAKALEIMASASEKENLYFKLASGYRSYSTQISVYNNEVRQYGQTVADAQSARPGHSEHQTGLALDLQDNNGQCVIADCFAELAEGKWLATNAWRFGFILRYPEGRSEITGYRYEPWHFRYVGVELSTEMHEKSIATLEEFFGLVQTQPY